MLSIERLYNELYYVRFIWVVDFLPVPAHLRVGSTLHVQYTPSSPSSCTATEEICSYKKIMRGTVQYIYDNEDERHYQEYIEAHQVVFQVMKAWEAQDVFSTVIENISCSCWAWMVGKSIGKPNDMSWRFYDRRTIPCEQCGRAPNDRMGALFDKDCVKCPCFHPRHCMLATSVLTTHVPPLSSYYQYAKFDRSILFDLYEFFDPDDFDGFEMGNDEEPWAFDPLAFLLLE